MDPNTEKALKSLKEWSENQSSRLRADGLGLEESILRTREAIVHWGRHLGRDLQFNRDQTALEQCRRSGHIGGDGDGRCDRCGARL